MSAKEYKRLIEERDEKEKKEAEKMLKDKELLEKRRAKQIERAQALAKLQREYGDVKFVMHGSMEEVYQQNPEGQKITRTYRPSKLPTRDIKTADPRERKKREEEERKKRLAEKVYKYDSIFIFWDYYIRSKENYSSRIPFQRI